MTAAAKTTIAMAAAIRPHGRCWVTTFAGGRVRPLPPGALPRCAVARFEPVPPRDGPLDARPLSGLGSLATAAPRIAGVPGARVRTAGPRRSTRPVGASLGPEAVQVRRSARAVGPAEAEVTQGVPTGQGGGRAPSVRWIGDTRAAQRRRPVRSRG